MECRTKILGNHLFPQEIFTHDQFCSLRRLVTEVHITELFQQGGIHACGSSKEIIDSAFTAMKFDLNPSVSRLSGIRCQAPAYCLYPASNELRTLVNGCIQEITIQATPI